MASISLPWSYSVTAGRDPYELTGQGIPRYVHEQLARNLGYTGDFGAGGHNTWLSADPTRNTAWTQAINEFKDTDPNTNFGSNQWLMGDAGGIPRWANQAINQYLGYQGGYGAGENNAWLGGDPTRQQQYDQLKGFYGAFNSALAPMMQQQQMGAFGMPMMPGMGYGGGYGMPAGQQTFNYNTYNQQASPFMDYGFGASNLFGGMGGFGGGGYQSDWGMGQMGGGGWGQPSAGSFMFKRGGRVGRSGARGAFG